MGAPTEIDDLMAEKTTLKKICAVAWVTFHDPGARLHSNSSLVGGIVADANHKIWLADLGGAHVIAIESPLFPSPARIPLAAVSGFGEA